MGVEWVLLGFLSGLAVYMLMRLTAPRVTVVIAPGDQFAAEVAQFRRELHDWDRDRRG